MVKSNLLSYKAAHSSKKSVLPSTVLTSLALEVPYFDSSVVTASNNLGHVSNKLAAHHLARVASKCVLRWDDNVIIIHFIRNNNTRLSVKTIRFTILYF